LSLDPIVRVIVNLSNRAAPRRAFNLGLIIGPSEAIPAAERVRVYEAVEDMLSDGFTASSPEYKAALLYFSAQKRPTRLAVGRRNADAEETALSALQACREANSEWYACYFSDAAPLADADILALAAYIESARPSSCFFFDTNAANVLSNAENNLFAQLKALMYRRTLGQYSGASGAAASIMGYAMGANTGTRNSAYTLAYKTEPGVAPDPLTNAQVEAIKSNYGNVYINRGEYYNVLEQGVCFGNIPFDEIINLDKLANDIQLGIMDALYQYPKVPQTEGGVTQIVNAITEPLEESVRTGFVAPGVWKGQDIMNLEYGDYLEHGYAIQPDSLDEQAQADRENRIAPTIYVAVKLAGAIEHVIVQVDVNR
jgi:hypothetical protein